MSEEEIMQIMDRFSIANSAQVSYSVTLDPATDQPVVEQVEEVTEEVTEEEVDEETVVIFDNDDEPSEEELERLHSASEEELDNDPDAYQDADVVDSEDPYDEFRTDQQIREARIQRTAEAARRAANGPQR